MKKIALNINILIVVLVIIFFVIITFIMKTSDTSNITIEIKEINIKKTDVSEVDLYNFGINRNSIPNISEIKAVYIYCEIVNNSAVEISSQPEFEQEQESFDFILGKRLELVDGYKPVVPAHKTKNMAYKFLIDSSIYSDEKIMEQLKNINFKIQQDGSVVLTVQS